MHTSTGAFKKVNFYLPLLKVDKQQQMVYGYASTSTVDSDGEVITLDAIKGALPDYMKFGNIREMHQLSAVGVAQEAEVDDKGLYLGAHIVDPLAWQKVVEGVYKGFSIGGRSTARDPDNINIITGLELIEISVVDRPANPEALIEVFKAEKGKMATTRKASQIWDCGIPGHAHVSSDQADACIADQDTRFGKDASVAVELRKFIATAVSELDPMDLVANANALAAAAGRDMPVSKKDKAERKGKTKPKEGDPDYNTNRENPPMPADNESGGNDDEDDNEDGEQGDGKDTDGKTKKKVPKEKKKDKAKDGEGKEDEEDDDEKEDAHVTDDAGDGKTKKKKEPASKKADTPFVYKKDSKKPYGDVKYADPGYQKDGKHRYPVDSEKHIRAAWSYINQEGNEDDYTPAQLKHIKDAIIAAWKEEIDKDGPPSASEKGISLTNLEGSDVSTLLKNLGAPDAKTSIQKGLYACISAISLLEQMAYLHKSLAQEAAVEGDNSPLPDRFQNVLELMTDLCKALLEEESEEMLNNTELSDLSIPQMVAYAKPTIGLAKRLRGTHLGNKLTKAIGDRTAHPGAEVLLQLAETIEEFTTSHGANEQTQEWGAHGEDAEDADDDADWQGQHDKAVQMGAKCMKTAAHTGKTNKRAPEAEDDITEMKKSLSDIQSFLADLAGSRRNPQLPARNGFGVRKGEDRDVDHFAHNQENLTPAEKRKQALTKALNTPNFMARTLSGNE